ncbi:MAG: hypothetical protein ABJP18_19045, partial [Lentilitoribacter sp.]
GNIEESIMMDKIWNLQAKIADLELELDELRAKSDPSMSDKSENPTEGPIQFGNETIQQQKAARISTTRYILKLPLKTQLSAPFVYGMIIPIIFLDICLFIYQQTCFRMWNLPLVNRDDYVIVDRHKLAYLNGIEKLNCAYCGYGNGVFALATEIAARTEHYWCPIKHASCVLNPHQYYDDYVKTDRVS